MNRKTPKTVLTVVIGTRNRLAILRRCLEALIGRIRVCHEIIVADAGSTDGTLEYLRGLRGIRLVCDGERLGQAKSLNRVVRTVSSRYVCWLSDDNVVREGALDEAAGILRRHADIGMVALKVKDMTGPSSDLPYIGGLAPSGILTCNQGMLRTGLFHRLGGFDEEFRDYGIDTDLTARVLLAGYKVAVTKQVAVHHYRSHEDNSWIGQEERRQRLQRGKLLYQQKHAALLAAVDSSRFRARRELFGSCYSYKGRKDWQSRFLPQTGRKHRLQYAIFRRLLRVMQGVHGFLRRLRLVPDWGRVEYCDRDWFNIFCSTFIRTWDLPANFTRPYYLLQEIPADLRNRLK